MIAETDSSLIYISIVTCLTIKLTKIRTNGYVNIAMNTPTAADQ